MRRVSSRLVAGAALVSAVVWVGTIVLWQWSWSTETVGWSAGRGTLDTVEIEQGRLVFYRVGNWRGEMPWGIASFSDEHPRADVPRVALAIPGAWASRSGLGIVRILKGTGYVWIEHNASPPEPMRCVTVGLSALPMAFLVVPLVCLGRWVHVRRVIRWRIENRCCAGCGYDLRATPVRCPECGAGPPSMLGGYTG